MSDGTDQRGAVNVGHGPEGPPLVSYPYQQLPPAGPLPGASRPVLRGPSKPGPKRPRPDREKPGPAEVYPWGVRLPKGNGPWAGGGQPAHLVGLQRGAVRGFSAKSAARLRELLVTREGPAGTVPYAVTLTLRREADAAEWRRVVQRFRVRVASRLKWWTVWRVELQRRRVPHLHAVMWVDVSEAEQVQTEDGFEPAFVGRLRREWLGAAGVGPEDWASWRYGVHARPIEGGRASGWACYVALHHGKAKESQLGWQGRQWGQWCGSLSVARVPVSVGLDRAALVVLARRLRRWSRGRYWSSTGRLCRPWRWLRWDRGGLRTLDALQTAQLLRGLGSDSETGEGAGLPGSLGSLPPAGPLRQLWECWGPSLLAGRRGFPRPRGKGAA